MTLRARFRAALQTLHRRLGEGRMGTWWPFWPCLIVQGDRGLQRLSVGSEPFEGTLLTQFALLPRRRLRLRLRLGCGSGRDLREVHTGDRGFDRALSPCGSDPDWARQVLDPWARAEVMDLYRLCPPGICWVVEPSVVCLYKYGILEDPDELATFFIRSLHLAAWSAEVA